METKKYDGMGVFQEAKQREIDGMGYRARRFKIVWQNKNTAWNWLMFNWGIRWSDKWQIFPIWNTSNNNDRALLFGIGKLYFEVIYSRKKRFNYERKHFVNGHFRKLYQLIS